MAITIITEQAAGINRKLVRVEMDDGYVLFVKVISSSMPVEIRQKAREVYAQIKEAEREQRRRDRIARRLELKVSQANLREIAAAEIDSEGGI